jgi:hypothetical protein
MSAQETYGKAFNHISNQKDHTRCFREVTLGFPEGACQAEV